MIARWRQLPREMVHLQIFGCAVVGLGAYLRWAATPGSRPATAMPQGGRIGDAVIGLAFLLGAIYGVRLLRGARGRELPIRGAARLWALAAAPWVTVVASYGHGLGLLWNALGAAGGGALIMVLMLLPLLRPDLPADYYRRHPDRT